VTWSELFEKWLPKLTVILKQIFINKNSSNIATKIFPTPENIFRVFRMSVDEIKIVLLGQDPYHGEGQANGLAFAVNRGTQIPPSLRNIFKELKYEFPDRNYNFAHGDLSRWQDEEGIFLINTSLTVIEGKPNSHSNLWEEFTDDVIKYINDKRCGDYNKSKNKIVYLLLGRNAQNKAKFVDMDKVIKAAHPSPLSANNGFLNTDVFKRVENSLGYREINWSI
jgi:uracil-DNA glycosylase